MIDQHGGGGGGGAGGGGTSRLTTNYYINKMAQAGALKAYLDCIRHTLDAALCLKNFPSQTVERHNKPEIEARFLHIGLEMC